MISILMPFKNEALHLDTLLSSLSNQTEDNFELIAVDDNSTDDSYKTIQDFATNDSRIKVFKNPGSGIISALQHAHSRSSGQYITRQDSDDIMPPDKLETLFEILKSNGEGTVATGKVEYFSDSDLKDGFKKYEQWLNNLCEADSHYDKIFKECIIASSNWLMHRNDFEKIGAFNDSIYPEDYHFAFKLYENNFKIKSTKKITHLWRDHSDRASRNLEQYRDQKFFPLKVMYFKKIFGDQNICLWGAGPTGKSLAKVLTENDIVFHWVTNNKNKIGKDIYGVEVHDFHTLKERIDHRLIISVTQRDALASIVNYLNEIKFKSHFEF